MSNATTSKIPCDTPPASASVKYQRRKCKELVNLRLKCGKLVDLLLKGNQNSQKFDEVSFTSYSVHWILMSNNSTTPKWHDVRSTISRWLLVALLLPIFAVHRIAFWLDEFVFPRLGKTALESPIFIVGLPRSGTTYFHRLLCSQRHAFTALPLWELLFAPALCEKHFVWFCYRVDSAVGAPIQRLLDFIGSICSKSMSSIHSTGLCDPEEDYLALLPFDGCFLRVLLFPLSANSWALAFPIRFIRFHNFMFHPLGH